MTSRLLLFTMILSSLFLFSENNSRNIIYAQEELTETLKDSIKSNSDSLQINNTSKEIINIDSLNKVREKYILTIDSLYKKKKNALIEVEQNVENFTKERKKIKNYRKEELISNLIYKLAYYYQGIEEREQLDIGEKLDTIFDNYKDLFEGPESEKYKNEYINKLTELSPTLTEQYHRNDLLSEEPGGKYKGEYKKTLEYYQKIIDNYPTSKLAPNSYYNIAYILYELGRKDEAVDIYAKIIETYPNSEFYVDANFALGEYFFDPELNPTRNTDLDLLNVNKAVTYYKAIVNANFDENYYYKALYRLGFCYYRMYDYDTAADYLTETTEKLYEKYGLEELPNDMRPLSLEYLAFSFKDKLWSDDSDSLDIAEQDNKPILELQKYINNRKKENFSALYLYGDKILKYLGDAYFEGDEYELSITTYDTLLSMYPLIKKAPLIQEKIIEAYSLKKYDDPKHQQEELYRERNQFFDSFKADSKWGLANKNGVDLINKMVSSNLYKNITVSLTDAQKSIDSTQFEITIEHIDEYLNDLPLDSNSYKLKWYKALILDKNLKQYLSAYDVFIELSNDKNSKFYYDKESKRTFSDTLAASGAISSAQAFSKTETESTPIIESIDSVKTNQTAIPSPKLTIGEKKQINAFKNYANLFIEDPKSKKYYYDAALIYHNKKDYEKNIVHLNDLIKRYPGSTEEAKSYEMLYQEYRELKNYAKAEEVVKKMEKLTNLTESQKEFVTKGKFSAIFNLAKTMEKEAVNINTSQTDSLGNVIINLKSKYLGLIKAADTYMRTSRENPDFPDADQSVWNASVLYSQAKAWDSVFVAYNYIIDNYKGKKNNKDLELSAIALFKMGALFTDTLLTKYKDSYSGPLYTSIKENNKKAAEYYEKFSNEYPNFVYNETNLTQKAVNDAAYFYKIAEEWESAIRMNSVFFDKKYEESEEAGVARYKEVAKFYRKLGKIEETMRIFQELVKKYPNGPYAVEASFERAKYFLTKNNTTQARKDFEQCYRYSKQLKEKGLKDFGAPFASEAMFAIAEWDRIEYEKILLNKTTPKANKIAEEKKLAEMIRINQLYQEIINLGQKEYGLSLIRQAQVFENNAEAIFNQKQFPSTNKIDDLGNEEIIATKAKVGYENAIEFYTSAISGMDNFIDLFDKANKNKILEIKELLKTDSTNIELMTRKRELENDSTIRTTLKLKENAKISILKAQYTLANVYKNLAKSYTLLEPKDLPDIPVNDLGYYDEMFDIWIGQMATPKITTVIEAHQKTLLISKDYNLLNNEWVKKSKLEIAKSADVIIDAYLRLASRLIDLYKTEDINIIRLNKQRVYRDADDFALAPKRKVDGKRVDAFMVHEKMGTITEYIGKAISKSVENYGNNFIAGKENLNKKNFDILKYEYLENIIKYSTIIDSLINYSNTRQERLNIQLETNKDLEEVYNDLGDEWLEAYSDQAEQMQDIVNELYELAFEKIKEYRINNKNTDIIFYELLSRKTGDYYEEFGFTEQDISFSSDFTWKTIPIEQKNWHKTEFDSKDWVTPDSVKYSETIIGDSIFLSNGSIPIWTHYEDRFDSLKYTLEKTVIEDEEFADDELTDEELALKNKHMYFFRKNFHIENLPLSGEVNLAVDDRFGFFINGISQFDMLIKEEKDDFETTFDDTLGWNKVRTWDVSEYLKEGENSIVVFALDMDEIANGLTCYFDIKMLNSELDRNTKLKVKEEENNNDDETLEDALEKTLIRIFKKNRIE